MSEFIGDLSGGVFSSILVFFITSLIGVLLSFVFEISILECLLFCICWAVGNFIGHALASFIYNVVINNKG